MDRLARHRAVCLSLALAAVVAACDDEAAGCPEVVAEFRLVEPGGAAELIPGDDVRITWPVAGETAATITFTLVDGDTRVPQLPVDAGTGLFLLGASTVPPGIYRIEAGFGGCAATPMIYDAGPLRLIYAQGARFAATELTFTGSQTPRDIAYATVTLSTIGIDFLATTASTEHLFARIMVPGELVATNRRVAFPGTTLDGTPIPDGTYRVVARFHARDALTYDVPGPMLTWSQGG